MLTPYDLGSDIIDKEASVLASLPVTAQQLLSGNAKAAAKTFQKTGHDIYSGISELVALLSQDEKQIKKAIERLEKERESVGKRPFSHLHARRAGARARAIRAKSDEA